MALLGLAIAGCSVPPAEHLEAVSRRSDGTPLVALGAIPDSILERYVGPVQLSEIRFGRATVNAAAHTHPEIQALLERSGGPDAIAVRNGGRRIVLYYGGSHTAHEFAVDRESTATFTGARPIEADELPALATGAFDVPLKAEIDAAAAAEARLWPILRALLATFPEDGGRAAPWYGFSTATANPWVLKALGRPVDLSGVVVTNVAPSGPAAGRLRAGDVITSIGGRSVTRQEDLEVLESRPTSFSFLRDAAALETTIEPVLLPLPLRLYHVSSPRIILAANPGVIIISSKLERGCDDGMLAFMLGHELAHLTSGAEPPTGPTAGGNLARILVAPVFFVPVAGTVASSAIEGAENSSNRARELEADRRSVEFVLDAGFDREAPLRATRYLQQNTPALGFIQQLGSTHPSYDNRLEAIRLHTDELCRTRTCVEPGPAAP